MNLIFLQIVKRKPENSDSDSDSDSDDGKPAVKKIAVAAKPVAKATPQKKQESSGSSDSDSSEEEKGKTAVKVAAKPVATQQTKVFCKLKMDHKEIFNCDFIHRFH